MKLQEIFALPVRIKHLTCGKATRRCQIAEKFTGTIFSTMILKRNLLLCHKARQKYFSRDRKTVFLTMTTAKL